MAIVVLLLGSLVAGRADAALIAYHVAAEMNSPTAGLGEYDSASIEVFLDPSVTNWIAWNDTPDVGLACATGTCLGPGGFGTDDSVRVTVTNPGGGSDEAVVDINDDWGVSSGTQNVLYGSAAAAPDVLRTTPSWHRTIPSVSTIFDEAGAFGGVFAGAGLYRFNFSFQNDFMPTAGHPEIYLLVDAELPPVTFSGPVPVAEPSAMTLFATGLIGLVRRRLVV